MLIQRPAPRYARGRASVPPSDGRLFVLVRHSGQRIVVARSASAAARRPTQSSFVNIEHVFLSIDVITVERRPTNSGTIQSRAIRIPDLKFSWPPAREPGTGRIVHVSRPDEPGAAGRIRTGTTRARSRFSNVADYWTRRCAAARIACAFLHRLSDLICSVSKRQPSPFIGV